MRQVIKHREIKLLKMIRRTDPVIPNRPLDFKTRGASPKCDLFVDFFVEFYGGIRIFYYFCGRPGDGSLICTEITVWHR